MARTEVVFLSKNQETYKAMKRAFEAVAKIDVTNHSDKLNGLHNVVIVDGLTAKEEAYSLICKIRNSSGCPVILFGPETEEVFLQDIKSKAFCKYQKAHKYFSVPFDLQDIVFAVNDSAYLTDEERQEVYAKYFHWRGLVKSVANHDLKSSLKAYKSKNRTIDIYKEIKKLIPLEYGEAIDNIDSTIQRLNLFKELPNNPDLIDDQSKEYDMLVRQEEYLDFLKYISEEE